MIWMTLCSIAAPFLLGKAHASSCSFMNNDGDEDGSLRVLPTRHGPGDGLVGEFLLKFDTKWLHMKEEEEGNFPVNRDGEVGGDRYDWLVYYAGKKTLKVENLYDSLIFDICDHTYEDCFDEVDRNLYDCRNDNGCGLGDENACRNDARNGCTSEMEAYYASCTTESCMFDWESCTHPKWKACNLADAACKDECAGLHSYTECEEGVPSCIKETLVEFHLIKVKNVKLEKLIGTWNPPTSVDSTRYFTGVDESTDVTLVYLPNTPYAATATDGVIRPRGGGECGEIYVGMYEAPSNPGDRGVINWISEETHGSAIISTKQIDKRQVIKICSNKRGC